MNQLARTEHAAIQDLVDRLARQFPELDRNEIERAVRGQYDGYQDSPIRDFLPILVERHVRTDLAHAGPRHRA